MQKSSWKGYSGYHLEDGRCSFDNNLSVKANAVVYIMVEMVKAHGVNIYGYLKFLLEHWQGKDMINEQLAELAS